MAFRDLLDCCGVRRSHVMKGLSTRRFNSAENRARCRAQDPGVSKVSTCSMSSVHSRFGRANVWSTRASHFECALKARICCTMLRAWPPQSLTRKLASEVPNRSGGSDRDIKGLPPESRLCAPVPIEFRLTELRLNQKRPRAVDLLWRQGRLDAPKTRPASRWGCAKASTPNRLDMIANL